ncbi:MAG: hypothetical protein AAF533_25785 [Acidobacteriota bacterium]
MKSRLGRSLLPAFALVLVSSGSQPFSAQAGPHRSYTCHPGEPQQGPLPEGTRFVDRLGRPWAPLAQAPGTTSLDADGSGVPDLSDGLDAHRGGACSVPPDCSTSSFRLTFEDVVLGTGRGFDDCAPAGGMTLGELRMRTACAVMEYVGSVIDAGTASPDVVFRRSFENPDSQVIAFASASYQVGLGPGFHGGNLRDHLVTGIDPTPGTGIFDGQVTVNFAVPMHPDHETSAGTSFDLFTVLLHEISHALGFASGMSRAGIGVLPGGGYTLYDEFLRRSAPAGAALTDGTTFLGVPADLTSSDLWYFAAGNTEDQPVYSPVGWDAGSSLSHFARRPTTSTTIPQRWVMRPSYSGGDIRQWTAQEIEVWCDLGYALVDARRCSGTYAVGIDDADTTTQGRPVTVDVIANDPGGAAVSAGGLVVPPPGVGTVSVSGSEITFTPSAGFCGSTNILYVPEDADGRPGSLAALTITVTCEFCPEAPCNLVCNGDFEQAPDPCFTQYDWTLVSDGLVPNWINHAGGSDLYSRHFDLSSPDPCDTPWDCSMTFSPPGFGIPLASHSCPAGGVDTWDWPAPGNDHYMGAWTRWDSGGGRTEGGTAPLVTELVPGQTYRACLQAFARQTSGATLPSIHVAFNVIDPGAGDPLMNTPGGQTFSLPLSVFNTWERLEVSFTATAPHAFVSFETGLQPGGPDYAHYMFLDEIQVAEDLPQIQLSKVVDDATPAVGDTVTLTIRACNVGKDPVADIELLDVLPEGLSDAGGFDAYPSHVFPGPVLPGECVTVELRAMVEPTIVRNEAVTSCVDIASPHASCVQPDNCAAVTVAATDILVEEIASPPQVPTIGEPGSLEITVTNLGPEPATDVQVLVPLDRCLTHDDHDLDPPGGRYDPTTGALDLPALAVGESVTLRVAVEIGCACLESCAQLESSVPPDFNPINDRDCAQVSTLTPAPAPGRLIRGFVKHENGDLSVSFERDDPTTECRVFRGMLSELGTRYTHLTPFTSFPGPECRLPEGVSTFLDPLVVDDGQDWYYLIAAVDTCGSADLGLSFDGTNRVPRPVPGDPLAPEVVDLCP